MELLRSSLGSFNSSSSSLLTSTTTLASIIVDNDLFRFNDSAECREVTRLHDIGLQCEFARIVDDCYDDSKIDYIKLTYCVLESQLIATLLFILMLAFLFVAIGTTADDFLCPLLVSISKSLKLSDNIAGVTFLAFGNGAPDIFSSIIGIGNSDPSMVIGQLYGGGIFVTTIVVGSILIRERFEIMHRPLLRDISFYLITTTLVWATFLSEKIQLFNSLIFIAIYLIYVIVVVASGIIYRRNRVIKEQEIANGGAIFSKKNATMPRDRLKRGKKYRIQSGFDRQISNESKSSMLSLRSFFRPENSDNYEGVVLRRIKFRKYPHEPMYERRLTAYNLPSIVELSDKPDLVLAVEPTYVAKHITECNVQHMQNVHHQQPSIYCVAHTNDADSTNNNNSNNSLDVNHNRGSEEDLNNNNGAVDIEYDKQQRNGEIMIDAKCLAHFDRRMTISDPSFPMPKSNPKKPKKSSKPNPEKFTTSALFSNLRFHLLHFFHLDNSTKQNASSSNKIDLTDNQQQKVQGVEPEITAKEFKALQKSIEYKSMESGGKESHVEHQSPRWWKIALQILLQISHFELDEFHESNMLGKVLMIVKAPIYLVFTLTIPVVDPELPLNGWNKALNLGQLILSPQCCLLITELAIAPLSRLQMHLLILLITLLIIPLVALTSEPNKPPSYHIVFAYFGFIIAISWIYTIANEVVSLLKAIGVIFNLSQFMLGLTFLAWGNSIGDFISNLTMARNGFPRMAISACFGGPVLNMLLGIGIPYTFLLIKQQQTLPSIQLVYSRMITIMYTTITTSLVTTIVILVFVTKFSSAKYHGFILYALYATFLVSAIFTEVKNLS